MDLDRSRRGCGKCGKAEQFCARLFQASRGNPRFLRISTDAALSIALRARRFFRVVEDSDITNGKTKLSSVRNGLQNSVGRADPERSAERRPGGTRTSNLQKSDRSVVRSVSRQGLGRETFKPGTSTRGREQKAQGQDWRSGHGDGPHKKIASLGSAEEKRRYIRDHLEELGSVSKACQVSGLAPSSFYYKSSPQYQRRRVEEDEKLRQQIERILEEFPSYGYRRIERELKRRRIVANTKRIRRVMKVFGLQPILWRRLIRTTDSGHALPVYPNLLKKRQVRAVNQAWVSDITYIRIRSSFVYLAAILDLYSRKVVGWAISKRVDTELCLTALQMALTDRPARGCIHHSDRGVQYASAAYVTLLRLHGLQISMSAKGNPYDNAFMESFYKTLKYEEVHLWNYETYEEVIERLPFFIEQVYNRKRLHSSIGYVPPVEFEANVLKLKLADRPVLNL
jgi:putative transposase